MVLTRPELQHIYQKSGLSQRAFARAIGVSDTAVRGWLNGENVSPENEERIRDFSTKAPTPTPRRDESGRSSALVPVVSDADKRASAPLFDGERLRLGEHVWIVGMPQSGKTTFALDTVQDFPRFVLLDFNGDIAPPGVPINASVNRAVPRQIIRVRAASEKAARAAWCQAILDALAMGDLALFLDELAPLTTSIHAPDALYQVLTYGRHRNVSVIVISHRPAGNPRIIPAATHHHCYFQMDGEDARNVQRLTGTDWQDVPDEPHAVYYYSRKTRDAAGRYELDGERHERRVHEKVAAQQQHVRSVEPEAPVPPPPSRETVTLPRAQIDRLFQEREDRGVERGKRLAKAEQKQLPANTFTSDRDFEQSAAAAYREATWQPPPAPAPQSASPPPPAGTQSSRRSVLAMLATALSGLLAPGLSASERPPWPYGDTHPESERGRQWRMQGRVPGWEL